MPIRLDAINHWGREQLCRLLQTPTSSSQSIGYLRSCARRQVVERYNQTHLDEPVCLECGATYDGFCGRCDACDDCCDCAVCSLCEERVASTCDTCDQCDDCCSCTDCEGCGCRLTNGESCESCFYCENCDVVRPERMYREGGCSRCVEDYGWVAPTDATYPDGPGRMIGLELEFADGAWPRDWAARWGGGIERDGSLPDGGSEITTRPASGDQFDTQLRELCADLRGASVTRDCGYHVHVDCRDFGWRDMLKLIVVYSRLESELLAAVPPSRRDNHYCEPCAKEMLAAIRPVGSAQWRVLRAIWGDVVSRNHARNLKRVLKRDSKPGCRYRALNLAPWLRQGTVECRLAAGSKDFTKIRSWAILWRDICEFAKSHSLSACWKASLESVSPMAAWVRSRQEELS